MTKDRVKQLRMIDYADPILKECLDEIGRLQSWRDHEFDQQDDGLYNVRRLRKQLLELKGELAKRDATAGELRNEKECLKAIIKGKDAVIARLKAGDLTPEEFNALCHNLHENGCPITPDQHEAECAKFRRELYGPKMDPLREKVETNWSPPPVDGERIVDAVRQIDEEVT